MTEIAIYFLKSASWLAGFILIYMLFLRNERYFTINRFYLLTGIVISFISPFFTIHYSVDLQNQGMSIAGSYTAAQVIDTDTVKNEEWMFRALIYSVGTIYVGGVLYLLSILYIKTRSLLKTISKADPDKSSRIKLIRSSLFSSSFSFFTWVFINPSVPETETREILKHEEVHIRQKHWIDLVLSQLLCIIQWFNPLVWLYSRYIRQNHEYLADDVVLQQSQDPALYRATLLNQMMGSPVFDLANFFSYSLSKNRFKMMKKIDYSPLRKLKLLAIMPVIAFLLIAFAEPEYRYATNTADISVGLLQNVVKGVVTGEAGVPLEGAAVVISGTTIGTTTDIQGKFTLKDVPAESVLMISYVGYKTTKARPSGNGEVNVKMEIATIGIEAIEVRPGISASAIVNEMEKPPIVMVDGKRIDKRQLEGIDPNSIETVSVLKDQSATAVFGDEGKNGVVIITTKTGVINSAQENKNMKPVVVEGVPLTDEAVKNAKPTDKDQKPIVVEGYQLKETYAIVEEMPSFPGGEAALKAWISKSIKYPEDAAKNKLSGEVIVSFVVNQAGKVQDVRVVKSVATSLDNEAVRVIKTLPDWKPGKQSGKPVDVQFNIPVSFRL